MSSLMHSRAESSRWFLPGLLSGEGETFDSLSNGFHGGGFFGISTHCLIYVLAMVCYLRLIGLEFVSLIRGRALREFCILPEKEKDGSRDLAPPQKPCQLWAARPAVFRLELV